jgi:hypothetical protein
MRVLALPFAFVLASAGCSGSKEDQLLEARRDQRAALDALYAEYGGGALAAQVKTEAQAESAREPTGSGKEILQMVSNAAGEFDRAAFEAQCATLGTGERPVIMNDKAKAFFAQSSVEKKCVDVAKRARRIGELETELAR